MVLHARFKSLYISLPSSAKQQRKMQVLRIFENVYRNGYFFTENLPLELNAVIAYLA